MLSRLQGLSFFLLATWIVCHRPAYAKALEESSKEIEKAQAVLLYDSLAPILLAPAIPDPAAMGPMAPGTGSMQGTPPKNTNFLKCLLLDQKAIWTSPLHVSKRDLYWMIPFAAATGGLIATDSSTSGAIANSEHLISVSNDISKIGAPYSTFGTAGAFFLIGSLVHNARAREAGILGTEALIDSSLVGLALKGIFQRERPYQGDGQGLFWAGGNSFPSGHTITTWSLAVVIAEEYSDHKLVAVGAYGAATLVSVARYTSYNHFLSDVLVGSVFGGLMGHYVYRAHRAQEGGNVRAGLKSHIRPAGISPALTSNRNRGLTLRWEL